jgi:hypothetical protein
LLLFGKLSVVVVLRIEREIDTALFGSGRRHWKCLGIMRDEEISALKIGQPQLLVE